MNIRYFNPFLVQFQIEKKDRLDFKLISSNGDVSWLEFFKDILPLVKKGLLKQTKNDHNKLFFFTLFKDEKGYFPKGFKPDFYAYFKGTLNNMKIVNKIENIDKDNIYIVVYRMDGMIYKRKDSKPRTINSQKSTFKTNNSTPLKRESTVNQDHGKYTNNSRRQQHSSNKGERSLQPYSNAPSNRQNNNLMLQPPSNTHSKKHHFTSRRSEINNNSNRTPQERRGASSSNNSRPTVRKPDSSQIHRPDNQNNSDSKNITNSLNDASFGFRYSTQEDNEENIQMKEDIANYVDVTFKNWVENLHEKRLNESEYMKNFKSFYLPITKKTEIPNDPQYITQFAQFYLSWWIDVNTDYRSKFYNNKEVDPEGYESNKPCTENGNCLFSSIMSTNEFKTAIASIYKFKSEDQSFNEKILRSIMIKYIQSNEYSNHRNNRFLEFGTFLYYAMLHSLETLNGWGEKIFIYIMKRILPTLNIRIFYKDRWLLDDGNETFRVNLMYKDNKFVPLRLKT